MIIVPHQFESKGISQLSEDMMIGDRLIPKGYCNATQMLKAVKTTYGGSKNLSKYLSLDSTKGYYQALLEENNRTPKTANGATLMLSSFEDIAIVIKGGNDLSLQGTWLHPEAAIHFAQWLNPYFAVWANRVLRGVINSDYQALTAEAEAAMLQVQKLWQQVRDGGIEVRKTFTQSIKESYLNRYPEADQVPFWEYSNPSDLLNVLLTGYPAKYWRKRFGFATDEQLRNHWGSPHLRRIERIEELAQVFVEQDGLTPLDAIKLAITTFKYQPWNEEKLLGTHDPKTKDRNRKRAAKALQN